MPSGSIFSQLGYGLIKTGLQLPSVRAARVFKEQSRLRNLLNCLDVNCVIDVGANKGFYAQHLRMMGYQNRIMCFEPIKSDFDILNKMAIQDDQWDAYNIALGKETTEKPFNVITTKKDCTVLSSFLDLRDSGPTKEVVVVSVKRLEDVLDERGLVFPDARFFLKIDTQGTELDVIEGVGAYMDKIVGVQCELSVFEVYDGMPHYTEVLEVLEQYGFRLMDLFVLNRTTEGGVMQYESFLARPEYFKHAKYRH